ncbi:MAG: nucleotidyltransferase domain-containing protein [bacterium]
MRIRVWRIDGEEILQRLKAWAKELGNDPSVLAVILFGSFARGEATPTSDADVLIVLSESALPFDERLVKYKPVGLGVSVEVFPYTLEEVVRGMREGWGMILPAIREGIILFKRESFSF